MKKKMLAASAVLSAAIIPAIMPASVSAQISDLYNGGTSESTAGNYRETGTVTTVLNVSSTANTFAVSDGTGSVLLYSIPLSDYTATVGDNISFSAYNSPYQNAPELTNSSSGAFSLTSLNSTGNPVSSTLLTITQFNAAGNGTYPLAPNAESLVTLDNVSIFNASTGAFQSSLSTNIDYTLRDANGNSALFYGYASDSAVKAAVTAANAANPGGFTGTYDMTGYADSYYGESEFYPLSITEVSSSPVPEPVSLGLLGIGAVGLLGRRRRRLA